jgi:predicted MPP superfamily phosphohydrolase
MSVNRRQFIMLSGLMGLGAAVASSLWEGKQVSSKPLMALPKAKPLLRFGVLADTGTGSMKQYAVGRALLKHHEQSPLNMVLLAGDNIYNGGEFTKIKTNFAIPYQDLLKSGVKFYACLGNHDARADVCGAEKGEQGEGCAANSTKPISNAQINYPQFNMKGQRYYTFTQGPVQFFATETNSLNNPNSPTRAAQLQWLDRELGKSKAKLKIVFGHHPIYSVGRYGAAGSLMPLVEKLLIKHQVPLWINGHDHNYQRSNPIDGVTYVVAGGGGAGLYEINDKLKSKASWSDYAQSIHSCATVDVHPDRLIITGIDLNGQVIDRGSVTL